MSYTGPSQDIFRCSTSFEHARSDIVSKVPSISSRCLLVSYATLIYSC